MPTAYRYWRARVNGRAADPTSNAGTFVGIPTLELRNSGGTNVATTGNGTASASTQDSVSTADKAFDANDATRWLSGSSAPSTMWLQWDFGAGNEQDVASVRVAASFTDIYHPNTVYVSGSNDLLTWELRFVVFNGTNEAAFDYIVGPLAALGATTVPRRMGAGTAARPAFTLNPPPTIKPIDYYFSGTYRIPGTLKISPDEIPVRRKVFLAVEPAIRVVAMTLSDAVTGAYSFEGISGAYKYSVIAYDYTHTYRAVVADNVSPEVTP